MYKVEYLPIAMNDMIEIARYIGIKLANPDAAEKIADLMVSEADKLCELPHRFKVYTPIKPLKHEYRKLLVKNYIMFYRIDELQKTVTIARVIYSGRDYYKLLD